MKVLLYIALSYFCLSQVISMSVSQNKGKNIPKEIFNSNEVQFYNYTEHKIKLIDLNDDCQLLVFQHLDLVSFLSLTETNNYFKSLVAEILKKIFRKKRIMIDLLESPWCIDNPSGVNIYDDYISIENVTIAEKVLTKFGHLIQVLELSENLGYPKMNNAVRSIYKLVNSHCSKTLKEIWLRNSVNHFFDEFTNQFENVQEVYISYSFQAERRLNEVFPSVRRLKFHETEIFTTDTFFANLDHLEMFLNVRSDNSHITEAAELIRKNPHIRILELELASPKLIKIAADSLPLLERLKLENIIDTYDNESIIFANVTELETRICDTYSLFLNTKFKNVEKLYADELVDSMFGETGFFTSNRKLKELQLHAKHSGIYLTNDDIRKLAYANSTLQDISLFSLHGFDSSSILQLLENSKQLKRLQIDFLWQDDCDVISKNLRNTIKDIWSMNELSAYTTILWKEK